MNSGKNKIWFRIGYDDADKFVIYIKTGSLTFTAEQRYSFEELKNNVLPELIKLDLDLTEEEEEDENREE